MLIIVVDLCDGGRVGGVLVLRNKIHGWCERSEAWIKTSGEGKAWMGVIRIDLLEGQEFSFLARDAPRFRSCGGRGVYRSLTVDAFNWLPRHVKIRKSKRSRFGGQALM